ncbi:SecY-interacting protein [Vibrio sp. UCD-FRSSP16_10]|uniref:SecY-interacting protein n=1 Tax=unclassified Vibrio TaxID=2614977 RepID=UPI0007FEF127|nr:MULTISPECIES: SecY-interacting protein [unclassified Vibrio]OBT16925.1 SecY-interacting protein [Vibrio sp. UCD-FRSSP16_30]OBT21847.1 SecY-interacting protein [Vibrio sp. UCD-FRSSP16_10]
MSNSITNALSSIHQQYLKTFEQEYGTLPTSSELVGVASPCIVESKSGEVYWQPIQREQLADFSNVEKGIELEIHSDIKEFYSGHYSADLTMSWKGKPLTLLQIWSDEDFVRLQENILGHLVTQRRLKIKPTVFIAAIDSDLDVISVCNLTGNVVLETLGTSKREVLTDNLQQFLQSLDVEV